MRKYTIDEIKEQIKKVHGNTYEYDFNTYIKKSEKMRIICPKHGEFWQTLEQHLHKTHPHGCPLCVLEKNAKKKRLSKTEINSRLTKLNNGLCKMVDNDYKNNSTPVEFKCEKHGIFTATVGNMLRNGFCPICRKEFLNKIYSKGLEKFLMDLQKVHGNEITTCEDSVYVNNHTKIKLCCHRKDENGKEHGEFWIKPDNCLSGQGCLKCKKNKLHKQRLIPIEEVKKRFLNIHNDEYSYDFSTYNGMNKKMRIICPKHGEFWQTPKAHVKGQGCPMCNKSLLEEEISNFLNSKNIFFEQQKTFEWLKYNSNLYLDFYLPDYKIAIECQGIQHFIKQAFFNDFKEENFRLRCERDETKLNLCNKNGITIIYYTNIKRYKTFLGEKITHNKEDLLKKIML